jgi:hypothetical protein
MALWWLSFSSETANLGIAIIEAGSVHEAMLESHRRNINPGGEVLFFELPREAEDQARPYRHRLIQRDEAERIFGPPSSNEQIAAAAAAGEYTLEAQD